MAITRLDLKNRILSSRGLTRAREDGLLTDVLLNEAVRDAQELVVADCNLFPVVDYIALVADKYRYPVPEEFLGIIKVYCISSSGEPLPLALVSQDEFFTGRNADSDKAKDPVYYCFPYMQQQVIMPFSESPSIHDFVEYSFVTTRSIRTVIDSGINLGRTLSGRRISPGDVVYNLGDGTDGSYGYVESLDTLTNKRTGTAGAQTSSTRLHDAGVDFTTLGIREDDLIAAVDSDGIVTTYAFVSYDGVAANYITYEDVRGNATAFASGNSYKIGVAKKIRLSALAPHRGLRGGANNRFYVADTASATLTGTTFTNTRVTGTGSLTNASEGQVAIASGGSHGEITEVGSNYLDVYCWVGGVPSAGETVVVKTCDKYQVQTGPAIERLLLVGPTPTTSDSAGVRRLMLLSNRRPLNPGYDWQELEIPEEYRRALYNAAYWMAAELTGLYPPERLVSFEQTYQRSVTGLKGNRIKDELDAVRSPYTNTIRAYNRGRRYMGIRSGIAYDISSLRN